MATHMLPDPTGKWALLPGESSGVIQFTECQSLCPGTCWQKKELGKPPLVPAPGRSCWGLGWLHGACLGATRLQNCLGLSLNFFLAKWFSHLGEILSFGAIEEGGREGLVVWGGAGGCMGSVLHQCWAVAGTAPRKCSMALLMSSKWSPKGFTSEEP